MIQFNLLPDVKLEYVKAQRTKHAVVSASIIAAGSAFAIFLLLFLAVHVAQSKNLKDLNKDIARYSEELKNTRDLDKILTIQNQLGSLTDLHKAKPAAARSFIYIGQLIPPNISLTDFKADFTNTTLEFTGQAPTLDSVNTLVDTLKFTTYSTPEVADKAAFKEVVMSQFSRNEKGATFVIATKFEPVIYDNAADVVLKVPNRVSTSSIVGQPADLFIKSQPSNGTQQ